MSEQVEWPVGVCRGCGKSIVWAETREGGKIPLDPVPPVYHVAFTEDGKRVISDRRRSSMVSHFATCPKASEFSRRRNRHEVTNEIS